MNCFFFKKSDSETNFVLLFKKKNWILEQILFWKMNFVFFLKINNPIKKSIHTHTFFVYLVFLVLDLTMRAVARVLFFPTPAVFFLMPWLALSVSFA
jgi:hypothetical protein